MTDVRLSVLGPVEAHRGTGKLVLGGLRQRSVLARLVVARGRVVAGDRLVEDVWGGDPPASASRTLHAYVSRLRRELGPAALERRGAGYRLNPEVVSVDLLAVEEALAVARTRGPTEAVAVAREALAAWRGIPFGDLAELGFLAAELAALSRTRIDLTHCLATALLALDRASEAAAAASDGWRSHPEREDLAAVLLQALVRTGRQAEAVEVFDRTRRHLDDELGVLPGAELRAAYQAVLDPPTLRPPERAAPRLPPRNRRFRGRGEFLTRVRVALGEHREEPRIVVLHGLGGVGKTQIALEAAHRHRADGGWVGWVTAEDPTTASAALVALAARHGLGPADDPDRAMAGLHAELARTSGWLLVLDNAEQPTDVETLLPPVGDGVVLLTSRNPAWRRVGDPVRVDVFDREESLEFVAGRLGTGPDASVEALAEVCGDLPLAMEQACAYTESSGVTLPEYLQEFGLARGAAFRPHEQLTWELSLRRVESDPAAAQVLSFAAFLAPESVPVELLQDVSDGTIAELLRYSLVDRDARGIRMHRLVQTAVRDRLRGVPRRDALERCVLILLDGLDRTSQTPSSFERLLPHVVTLAGRVGEDVERTSPASAPPRIVELLCRTASEQVGRAAYGSARRLLETALALTDPADTVQRAEVLGDLGRALDAEGDVNAALGAHHRAYDLLAADPATPGLATGRCLARMGRSLHCAGRGGEAVDDLERALVLLADHGAPVEETVAVLTDLGYAQWAAHQLAQAGASFSRACDLGTGPAAVQAMSGLGMVRQDLGDLQGALEVQRRVLDLQTTAHGRVHPVVGETLDKLGYVLWSSGEHAEAQRTAERAVDVLRATFGVRDPRTAMGLTNLGLPVLAAGDPAAAESAQTQALELLLEAYGPAHPHVRLVRRRLAAVLRAQGRPGEALVLLDPDQETGVDRGRARGHRALALRELGRNADELVRQAIDDLRGIAGEPDPEVAALLTELATGPVNEVDLRMQPACNLAGAGSSHEDGRS